MIFKLHHIGITVPSLTEAQAQLEPIYPSFHEQRAIATPACLNAVSLHRPSHMALSLHRRPRNIDIELMEYPRVESKLGSLVPWEVTPHQDWPARPESVAALLEDTKGHVSFDGILELLSGYETCNAVIVPVPEPERELGFWQSLGFGVLQREPSLLAMKLASRVPPPGDAYVVLCRSDRSIAYHTDLEGINEVAFLCASAAASLEAVRDATFRSCVSQVNIAGRTLDIAFLRSPSGLLVELFSLARA